MNLDHWTMEVWIGWFASIPILVIFFSLLAFKKKKWILLLAIPVFYIVCLLSGIFLHKIFRIGNLYSALASGVFTPILAVLLFWYNFNIRKEQDVIDDD